MPFMAIYRRDDISAAEYDKFRAAVPLEAAPLGSLSHIHARLGDEFVSIDVWEDAEALAAFNKDVLKPATEALGHTFVDPQIVEVETFVVTPATSAYGLPFVQVAEPA